MQLRRAAVLLLLSSATLLAQHNHGNDRTGVSQPAPALKRVGTISHPVATHNPKAQQYFNQGIAMLYAFNHLESERSFAYAAQLDPKLPIAYWGVALAVGSNINDPITTDREQRATEAINKAIALRRYANKPERDYIDALAKRYTETAIAPPKTAPIPTPWPPSPPNIPTIPTPQRSMPTRS